MNSHRAKRILYQIIPFGVIPAVFSIVYSLIEKGIMGDASTYPSTGNFYDFQPYVPAILSFVIGALIGALEIFYISKWFKKNGFLFKIVVKTALYMALIGIAIAIISISTNAAEMKMGLFSSPVLESVKVFFTSFAFWSVLSFFSLAVMVSLFYSEVSDNIGQSVLINFFTGKYHQPIEEERAYMFLDMKSSTTFAEKLGHQKYFKMLKEYYRDLSQPIVDHGGEIYQYVGDEIVISWKLKK